MLYVFIINYNPQMTVFANFYSMSRDSAYFPDPDSFIPERWDREKGDVNAFTSLPFGFGPRGCYGKA